MDSSRNCWEPPAISGAPSSRPTSSKRSVILSMRWRIDVLHGYGAAVRAVRGMARHFIVSSMNRHGISILGTVAAAVVIGIGGCSAARTTQTVPEQGKDASTLTLMAELALERGDCRLAAEDYAAAAMQSAVAVARRASEVGLACENLPAAWQSAQRWRALGAHRRGCGNRLRRHCREALQDPGCRRGGADRHPGGGRKLQ